jgi:hypothetical protein
MGEEEHKLGIRASSQVFFNETKVSENMLSEKEMVLK